MSTQGFRAVGLFYVPRKVSQLRTKNKQRSCVSLCFLSILILNILFLGLTVLRNCILKKALLKLPKFYPFKLTPLVFSGFRLFCVPWRVSFSLYFSARTRNVGKKTFPGEKRPFCLTDYKYLLTSCESKLVYLDSLLYKDKRNKIQLTTNARSASGDLLLLPLLHNS